MAIEYTMSATCDKCGAQIEPPQDVGPAKLKSVRWQWERAWQKRGVLEGLPNRFGKRKLYCARCAGG